MTKEVAIRELVAKAPQRPMCLTGSLAHLRLVLVGHKRRKTELQAGYSGCCDKDLWATSCVVRQVNQQHILLKLCVSAAFVTWQDLLSSLQVTRYQTLAWPPTPTGL